LRHNKIEYKKLQSLLPDLLEAYKTLGSASELFSDASDTEGQAIDEYYGGSWR
jgi:hypothetical protein